MMQINKEADIFQHKI